MGKLLNKCLEIDKRVSNYFALQNNKYLGSGFLVISRLGSGIVFILILVVLLVFFYNYFARIIICVLLAEITGVLIIIILRYSVKRNRPKKYHPFWLAPWNKYSFPSHHAYRSFMAAIVFGIHFPLFSPLFIFIAGSISFSRLYLLKHYLTDVIVGALLGIFIGAGIYVLMQQSFFFF